MVLRTHTSMRYRRSDNPRGGMSSITTSVNPRPGLHCCNVYSPLGRFLLSHAGHSTETLNASTTTAWENRGELNNDAFSEPSRMRVTNAAEDTFQPLPNQAIEPGVVA